MKLTQAEKEIILKSLELELDSIKFLKGFNA